MTTEDLSNICLRLKHCYVDNKLKNKIHKVILKTAINSLLFESYSKVIYESIKKTGILKKNYY